MNLIFSASAIVLVASMLCTNASGYGLRKGTRILEPELTDTNTAGILPWDWDGDQWNTNLKDISEFAVSQIPVVGELVSLTIELFWPENQQDMFEQMETQIEFLIGQAIIKENQQLLNGQIEDIKTAMTQYNQSETNNNKGTWLDQAISDSYDAYHMVTTLDPDYTYIPWMVQISALHLSVLRERYLFGEEIWGTTNPTWKSDLQTAYDNYNTYFNNAYPAWKSYRDGKITGQSASEYFQVTDAISGTEVAVCWEDTIKYNCQGKLAPKPHWSTSTYKDGTINAMRQEVAAQMVSIMEPTWWNFRYLPWMESQTAPLVPSFGLQSFKLGPYASWGGKVVGVSQSPPALDTPGIATGAFVSVYNSVDYMYIEYEGHNGKHVGDTGGAHHQVNFQSMTGSASAYLQAFFVNFWYYSSAPLVGSVKLYANSDEGKIVESVLGWDGGEGTVNMTMGTGFQLVQLGQIGGPGPSGTSGTIGIEASFMYGPVAASTYGS